MFYWDCSLEDFYFMLPRVNLYQLFIRICGISLCFDFVGWFAHHGGVLKNLNQISIFLCCAAHQTPWYKWWKHGLKMNCESNLCLANSHVFVKYTYHMPQFSMFLTIAWKISTIHIYNIWQLVKLEETIVMFFGINTPRMLKQKLHQHNILLPLFFVPLIKNSLF